MRPPTSFPPRIVFLDIAHKQDGLTADRQALMQHLSAADVDFRQTNIWSAICMDADLLVACDPVRADIVPDGVRIVGQRTLNRKTRLDAVRSVGARVVPYFAPKDGIELVQALADWGDQQAVVKFDWSFQRVGVFLWPPVLGGPTALPNGFDPACDIVMRRHIGKPETIKVDTFAGHILGATILLTRDIAEPNWQDLKADGQILFQLDIETAQMVAAASRALMPYGVGYASFDLMQGPEGCSIIEVNTAGVGTKFWQANPEPYAERFADALIATLSELERYPLFGVLRSTAVANHNDNDAPDLVARQSGGDAKGTAPVNLGRVLDTMMRDIEAVPESERIFTADSAYRALREHATATTPYYASIPSPHDQRPVSRTDVQHFGPAFMSRASPKEHGRIEHAYSGGLTQPPLIVCRSHFAHQIDSAVHRRALRWIGVEEPGPILRLLGPTSARQAGLGTDMDYEDLLNGLKKLGRLAIWSRPSILIGLAQALGPDRAHGLQLSGIISSHEPLGLRQKAYLEDCFGTKIAEIYHVAGAGAVGIRCNQSRCFHLMSDVVKAEVLDQNGQASPLGSWGSLVVTSLYNFAMPLLRFNTADSVRVTPNQDDSCACGQNLPRVTLAGRTQSPDLQTAILTLHDGLDPAELQRICGSGIWQIRATGKDQLNFVADFQSPLPESKRKKISEMLESIVPSKVTHTVSAAPLLTAALLRSHQPVIC